MQQIYILVNGEQQGPFTPQQVRGFLNMGHYQHTDMAWHEGLPEWKPLAEFPEFALKHKTPNYKAVSFRQVKAKKESKAKGILTTLAFLVVAGAVGAGGYYYWKLQRDKKAEAARKAAEAEAAKTDSGDKFPKTLDALGKWYEEPAAGQNAAAFFEKGFAEMQISDADEKSYTLPFFGKGAVPPITSPVPGGAKNAANAFLERNKAAMEYFRQAVACSGSRYPIDLTKGMATPVTHTAKVREAAQMAELSAILNADARDGNAAAQDIQVALAAGRSLSEEPILYSQLIRVACNIIAADALEQVVNRTALPVTVLPQLQSAFARAGEPDDTGASFSRGLVGERVSTLAALELPADKLRESLAASQTALPAAQTAPLGNLQEQRDFLEESFNQLISGRKESFPGRLKADDTVPPRLTDAQGRGFTVVSTILPGLNKVTAREGLSLARMRLAQAALALEQGRATSGSYPATLGELAPQFISAVPNDPFDGQPLRYRKAGEGYLLYSVGPDAKDDGGVRRAGSDDLYFVVARAPKM